MHYIGDMYTNLPNLGGNVTYLTLPRSYMRNTIAIYKYIHTFMSATYGTCTENLSNFSRNVIYPTLARSYMCDTMPIYTFVTQEHI